MRPIRSLRANEPRHDVTYDKECDVTEEPHFSYRSCSQCSLLLDGLCFQVLRLVRVRFFFETNASKISKENEQLLFPNYVCNENEEGRASSFANLFYDHHCKKGTILTKQLRYRKIIVGLMILL